MKDSVGTLAVVLLFAGLAMAASIPAWLDDAISTWNQENPDVAIQFLNIKDSFVWYMFPKTDDLSHAEIRERMYVIAEANGYQKTAEEELITTGKPPSPTEPYKAKKCWSRSFTLNVDVDRQRVLTTLLCEDATSWYTGFRIIQ